MLLTFCEAIVGASVGDFADIVMLQTQTGSWADLSRRVASHKICIITYKRRLTFLSGLLLQVATMLL